jgi:uncharacterized protein YbjT (DUF2867 family)
VRILITGGTRQLGRELIPSAIAAGHTVRVLTRKIPTNSPGNVTWAIGDLATGAGLPEAVAGIDAIIHAASDPRHARVVDVGGTRRLVDAARTAGVAHVVYVSIVGVDRIPYAYYQRKLEAERVIAGSGVPFSILRATQFHPFVSFLLRNAWRLPFIMPIPSGFVVQSVAIEEVAARLCRALDEGPRGMLRDFGGPEILTIEEATTAWLRHGPRGYGVWPVPIYLPGKTARAFRSGHNTCPDGDRGTITWNEWLERDFPPRRAP